MSIKTIDADRTRTTQALCFHYQIKSYYPTLARTSASITKKQKQKHKMPETLNSSICKSVKGSMTAKDNTSSRRETTKNFDCHEKLASILSVHKNKCHLNTPSI